MKEETKKHSGHKNVKIDPRYFSENPITERKTFQPRQKKKPENSEICKEYYGQTNKLNELKKRITEMEKKNGFL